MNSATKVNFNVLWACNRNMFALIPHMTLTSAAE
jgi:hypothetical protein